MSRTFPKRSAGPVLGSVLVAVVLAIWFATATGDRPVPEPGGSVTMRTVPAAPRSVGTAPQADPLLAPPKPPPLAEAVAAAPDAFIGDWRTPGDARLTVTVEGNDRYGVTLDGERYDGVLKDGRVHFPRGIDGEWLQATADGSCLLLGSGTRFCR